MKVIRFDPYPPIIGVVGLIAVWYLAVWYQVVDPVLLPSPTDTVERHGRRPARFRFRQDSGAHHALHIARRRDRHPARGLSRLFRKNLPFGRVRIRLLPL